MNKGVAIAGATGEVGKRLVKQLIAHNPKTPIFALVRKKSDELPPQVTQHEVDFNNLGEFKLNGQIHMAYCCLGSTIKKAGSKQAFQKVDHHYPVVFADWVKQHGCESFACITAVGANHLSKNFYLKVKGDTEHDLTQKGFRHLWLIRPSLLLGQRDEFRLGEYIGAIASRLISPFLIGPLAMYKPIQMMEVASTMAKLADKTEETKEGCHVLQGQSLHSD